ncbi:NUDIX hydrolase [Cryptosporangium aurantiacum]|uniref:ADP-ribose pyrophosphatase YjhB, NUDIX family n=1 Tax=Cryptosporangium aurantiacum TaxID=134849 RepID=A0A1M7REV4_9ACTN|nr:NUDIX hydrolase [Cryptosporangium aurantiacum]SHN44711.1 ADP-ribose pyrophosphatase YjhB, NUDIX family [Cryptosporangium aurantiacum]
MAELPLRDRFGNVLVGHRSVADEPLDRLAAHAAVSTSLIVVVYADSVLMIFDSWRRQWELPGGTREPGETPEGTAARELDEETGIRGLPLSLAAVAEFHLTNPERRELLAVYLGRLEVIPPLRVNDEALAFRWWLPSDPVSEDMSPLDAEIARRVVHARPGTVHPRTH